MTLWGRHFVVGRWVLTTDWVDVAGSGVSGGFDDRVVGSIARFETALTRSFGCFDDSARFDRSVDRSYRFDQSDRLFDRLHRRFARSGCFDRYSDHFELFEHSTDHSGSLDRSDQFR